MQKLSVTELSICSSDAKSALLACPSLRPHRRLLHVRRRVVSRVHQEAQDDARHAELFSLRRLLPQSECKGFCRSQTVKDSTTISLNKLVLRSAC